MTLRLHTFLTGLLALLMAALLALAPAGANPASVLAQTVDPAVPADARGFIGERFDADAGLQYLNARYYDPELGLFLQPDWFEVTEAGVGTNRYAYSLNDPVNLRDPGGNRTWGEAFTDIFRSNEGRRDANARRAQYERDTIHETRDLYLTGTIGRDAYEERVRQSARRLGRYKQLVERNGGSALGIAADVSLGIIDAGVLEGGAGAYAGLSRRVFGGSAISARMANVVRRAPPFSLPSRQWGRKSSQHMRDFGLSVSDPAARTRFREYVEDIGNRPDVVFRGSFAGQGPGNTRGPVLFFVKNVDVVVTTPTGAFITILRGGITNTSVRAAWQ